MATIYVDSAAGGANDGTSWTDAYTSLASADGAGSAAGDTVLVDDGHSESLVNLDFSGGTFANPVKVFCVDKNNSDALSSGASFTHSAARAIQGHIRVHGLSVSWSAGGLTIGSTTDVVQDWEGCTFTSTAGNLNVGGIGTKITLANPTINFAGAAAGNYVNIGTRADVCIRGGSYAMRSAGQNDGWNAGDRCYLDARDLVMTNSCTDFILNGASSSRIHFAKCTLPTLSNYIGSTPTVPGFELLLTSCGTGTITVPELGLTRYEDIYGIVSSSLSKYRTGGADDGEQANAHSWEMVSNTNTLEVYGSLVSPPLAVWVAPDASPSGATPKGLSQSTRVALQGTPAALTTDGVSTWNGTGVGTKQKIEITIGDYTLTVYVASGGTLNDDDFWVEVSAPDQVGGPVIVRCYLAKPSTTIYVDPKLEIA